MINTKHTKKALLISVLSLVLCFSMFLGMTFAWFTDSATSTGNIIKTGDLYVGMYWADGTEAVPTDDAGWTDASSGAIFDYDKWEPGYVEVRHIKIANEGSLALKYKVNIIANGEVSDLSDAIDVYYVDPAIQVADRTALTADKKLGTLTDVLAALGETGNGTLEAGKTDVITIAFMMQEDAGNEYKSKSIGSDFSIQLLATQFASEDDSFGKDYDAEAAYPNVSVPVVIPSEDVVAPMTLAADGMEIEVPAGVINNLPAEVTSLAVAFSSPVVENNKISFSSVDLVDQNGNKVDLEGNTEAMAVTLPTQTGFAPGEAVFIYHDDELVAITTVNADGTISYEAEHFCEVVVSDVMTVNVNTAAELIEALTVIKIEAKKQIPGENGNKAYRAAAKFILADDIVIDKDTEFMYTDSNGAPLHFYGVKGVLDLNGHTITVTEDALLDGKAYANAVLLIQYSNIDIIDSVGNGGIVSNNKSVPVYGWANSTVNIYGGNYETNAFERNESAVYVNNPTVLINVYGGTYTDSAYAFNVHDNCGTTTTIVLHEGITYKQFLKSGTTDVTASDINKGRIAIADGCELVTYEENGINMLKVVKE